VKRITFLISVLLAIFTGVSSIDAHGGGDLIVGPVQAGPYRVSVWVNPPVPRALEAVHFTVGVAAPGDSSPVLDADVMVEMRAQNGEGTDIIAQATTEQSVNKLFYETDMEVPNPGPYETTFSVRGLEGEGAVSLIVEVKPASRVNWLVIGLVGLGLVVVLGWWRSRKAQMQVTDG